MKKIDIHNHTFLYDGVPRLNGEDFASVVETLAMYEKLDVDKAIILPVASHESSYNVQSLGEVMAICEKYPDRFYFFFNMDPRAGENSTTTDFTRIINYYKERGAKGVGELTCHLYFDDPFMLNFFWHCENTNMPVLFHTTSNRENDYGLIDDVGFPRLEKILNLFPNLVLIGHSIAFWSEISADVTEQTKNNYNTGKVIEEGAIIRLMRKYPNLKADLSAGSGANAMMRDEEHAAKFMTEFSDRVYFGLDICSPKDERLLSCWMDKMLSEGKISEEVYQKICRKNAESLLNLHI